MFYGGIFDYAHKKEILEEVNAELESPSVWDDPEKARKLGAQQSALKQVVETIDQLDSGLEELDAYIELAVESDDASLLNEGAELAKDLAKKLDDLEFQRMFSGDLDANNAYVDVQSGSGGTEAQDWAEMLLRMYLRWAESHNFKATLMECSAGDVAGIKSATIYIEGPYAFGWLRTEIGVHRLVRKSPFDSGNRRHTSFAAIFVSPEVDDDIEIEINPADLRIDTYRASGAGGQHVNKTDSAVRITHMPTNTVVQCQNDRSQHKNKSQAMKQLKAKLYELKLMEQQATQQEAESAKSDIGWGSQIRSYVLDQARIKDLRTGYETGNTQAVLDGNLDAFIQASLKQGV